ncbi:MAG: lipopolysaccharide transport periplasmic protein LptA [Thermodesulfobacteriota bacterium]
MDKRIVLKWMTVVLIALSFLFGCAGKAKEVKKIEGDPEVLYKEGLVYFNNRDYSDALKKFEGLKSSFPDSPPFTHWAELKVGDCHFLQKEYVEAIASYEEFKKIHPGHEEIPYVQFQIGMSYYNQMFTPDRDQTPTKKALSSFEYLVANYPPGLFTEKAKEKISACKKRLAENEFYVANFYYKQGRFGAAASRFEELLQKFPKDPDEDKTLYFLGKSCVELEQWEKAEIAFMRVVTDYPKSVYYKESRAFLDKGLTERKASLSKTKAKEPKKKVEVAATEPDQVALVKFEEEGKQPVSLKEERKVDLGRQEERLASPSVESEPVKAIPPKAPPAALSEPVKAVPSKEETKKDTPPAALSEPVKAVPVEEETKKETPPVALSEPVKPVLAEEETKKETPPVAFNEPVKPVPSKEEAQKNAPVAIEPIQEGRTQAIAPSSEAKQVEPLRAGELMREDRNPPSAPAKKEAKPAEEKRTAALSSPSTLSKEKETDKKGILPEAKEAKLVDKSQPIDISSDKVEAFWKENLIIFRGNAIARQKDMVIYADSIEALIIEDGKGIERVTAGGNVKIQQGLRVANCEKAIFYNLDQKVILTGDPKVSEGDNIVSGDEIIFDIDQNRVEVKGGTSGRGKAKIQPGGEIQKLK